MQNGVTQRPREPTVSVVIPAKNEARNLEIVLLKLPIVHEVILVDGHSVDDTVDTARRVMPSIRVLTQTRQGKGNALACGFEAATGDIIVMFDADGSADPLEIVSFVEVLKEGADFAKGSRFRPGGGSADITRFRRYGNTGLNLLANILMGTHYTDLCYGYNAFWTDLRSTICLPDPMLKVPDRSRVWGDGFEVETVINCRIAAAKLAVVEVPSFERIRMSGASNLNALSDGVRVLKTLIAERRRARHVQRWPLRETAQTSLQARDQTPGVVANTTTSSDRPSEPAVEVA